MKKIKLVGKNLDDIRPLLPEFGLEECDRDFELAVCHGGDGALLGAAREYPDVPKLPLRDEGTAPTCSRHHLRSRLENFSAGLLKLTRLPILTGQCKGNIVKGINDIFVHHTQCASTLRFRVKIDGELYAPEVLGDGVGLSSVHGSTAYYRSITHSVFRIGIGLAFSNSTVGINHLVLDPRSKVEIEILRGPGALIADNGPVMELAQGDVVTMGQSDEFSEILGLEEFMCPECRALRHGRGSV